MQVQSHFMVSREMASAWNASDVRATFDALEIDLF